MGEAVMGEAPSSNGANDGRAPGRRARHDETRGQTSSMANSLLAVCLHMKISRVRAFHPHAITARPA